MTDGPVRVWPRQALVAERVPAWWVVFGPDTSVDDNEIAYSVDEFAAHFVLADRLDRLLAAVEAVTQAWDMNLDPVFTRLELCAAWRAYVE